MPTDALISRTIGSLINGVSLQPAAVRHKSQNEAQEDCISDIVEGVSRRPPTEHVALIEATPAVNGYKLHSINRDTSEQYIVLFEDGAIRVFDYDGVEQTVTTSLVADTGGDLDYFATTNPRKEIQAVTIADFTFIANKNITVAMSGSVEAASA